MNHADNQDILSWTLFYMSTKSNLTESDIFHAITNQFGHIKDVNEISNKVIEKLNRLKLINDNRAANKICNKNQHKGDIFLRHILKQKGISDDDIEMANYNSPDVLKDWVDSEHSTVGSKPWVSP